MEDYYSSKGDIYHVKRGAIKSLMTEINAALVMNNAEEVQPLRLELYAASMQRDCDSDLQSWISYLLQRAKKLGISRETSRG